MNRRRLSIYLSDHLAAGGAALSRARASIRSNRGTALAESLEGFARDAEDDRRALLDVMRRLGIRRARYKELAALASERAGRLKLNGSLISYSPLSRLEELELFAAGAEFKAALWETLRLLSEEDARLDGPALEERRQRAHAQSRSLAELRRRAVRDAFA